MKTFSKIPGDEAVRGIPCPACGSRRLVDHWVYSGFTFVRCLSCKLIHQNPQPLQKDLTSRYDDEYFLYQRNNETNFFLLMKKALNDIEFHKYRDTYLPGGTFLDVGCSTGKLIASLSTEGWSTCGVEVCEPAAEYGRERRGCDIFTGTLEEAQYSPSRFDVVHCSHVIEHLTDPVGFISEVWRVLKPGGLYIITTPNAAGFQARLFGKNWRSAIADHMILFSKSTLPNLLARSGFTVSALKTWGGFGIGTAPVFLKRIADFLAKPLGIGDVMVMSAIKEQ